MKLANLLLLGVMAVGVTACSYDYFASASIEPEAFELDENTPVREFRVKVCYEGEGEPSMELSGQARITNASPSEVTFDREDHSEALSMERHHPTELYLDGLDVDEACDEGWVLSFALAPQATALAAVAWSLRGTAHSSSEEAVEDGEVTIVVEALEP